MLDWKFAMTKWMQTITVYEWGCHLLTFKHYNSEEALIFKDFTVFYSVTFDWEFFSVDWENDILFSSGNMTKYWL
jgi:hypothetical protein